MPRLHELDTEACAQLAIFTKSNWFVTTLVMMEQLQSTMITVLEYVALQVRQNRQVDITSRHSDDQFGASISVMTLAELNSLLEGFELCSCQCAGASMSAQSTPRQHVRR